MTGFERGTVLGMADKSIAAANIVLTIWRSFYNIQTIEQETLGL